MEDSRIQNKKGPHENSADVHDAYTDCILLNLSTFRFGTYLLGKDRVQNKLQTITMLTRIAAAGRITPSLGQNCGEVEWIFRLREIKR